MLKEPVSPWPHTTAFVLAAIGVCYLATRFHANLSALAVMTVYGCGLLLAFGASAVYHWLGGRGKRTNGVLRRIDHAAIYALVAGTYTPILYFGLDGAWRIATLCAVWSLAALGMAQAIWFVGAPRAVSATFYVALGWAAVIPFAELAARLSHLAIGLIILGGVLYSLGAIVYVSRSFNFAPGRFGFHEIFHLFVVAGAAAHFAAIAFTLVPA
ncbi:MAG: PAQR family membrane homeostasis protein TrhA [Vulcanimicrobiaceae bacterium]